jgi:hypothetical protein
LKTGKLDFYFHQNVNHNFQKMGLQIAVVIGKKETFRFDVGRYAAFTVFREYLVKAIRGEASAKRYKKKADDVVEFATTGKPSMNLMMEMMFGNKRMRCGNELEDDKEPDLDILLNHSDCDGDLSKEECTRLLALFEKYADAFKQDKEIDEHYQEVYKNFMVAFKKVVNSKSANAKVIFS